jgi:hypothetical protein
MTQSLKVSRVIPRKATRPPSLSCTNVQDRPHPIQFFRDQAYLALPSRFHQHVRGFQLLRKLLHDALQDFVVGSLFRIFNNH